MTYLDLLPIDRRVVYGGLVYAVRAVWSGGAVCVADSGACKVLEGAKALGEVRPVT